MLTHLQPLIKKSNTRSYKSGSTILYQGEAPRYAHILSKGVVKVFSISAQGDEQIVMYHVEGEFFPSSWIFNKSQGALFFYEAVTDCEIALAPPDEMIEFMLSKPESMKAMFNYFTTNYSASLIHVNALEQPKARDKLLYTLYFLCQRYGDIRQKKTHIPFALTHQNLASLVGITRETAATEMGKLKNTGLLTYVNQKYIIDAEKLLELIGEDSLKDINIRLFEK
ncbi:Crp/Fnr family transcriptional regulator [Candidatus Saccharibacteria bacterium]|nr:Crp/Fnr family transcriptional regulator [Candidatus Saccharibacteria bacterium]